MALSINGIPLAQEVLKEEFEDLKEHFIRMGQSVCCDREAEIRSYARENVIHRTLLEQESTKRFGEIPDSEVEAEYSRMIAEHGGKEAFSENTGFSENDLPKIFIKLRSKLAIDKLLAEEVVIPEQIDDDELEQFYQENRDRFLRDEQVRVSQILIEPRSHSVARESYEALREVRARLLNNENLTSEEFDEVARSFGTNEGRPIDLGFMNPGETMPELESIIFSMLPGEISPVVATHYGFHLFRVTEKKDREPIPRAEIDDFEETYREERRSRAINSLLERLKDTAQIEELETSVKD